MRETCTPLGPTDEAWFCACAEKPLHLAILLPMTGSWNMGTRIAGAAALAVKEVNTDSSLLAGFALEYSWADSGCSSKQGLAAMGELLDQERKVDALIGPGCSSACEVTSYLSGGHDIVQISWGCTSPTLSDHDAYPLFSRTVASEVEKIPAVLGLMRLYTWTKLVILTSTEPVWRQSGQLMADQFKAAGIDVRTPLPFDPGNFNAHSTKALDEIKTSGFRVIMLMAYDQDVYDVASAASLQLMTSVGWAWLLCQELIHKDNWGTEDMRGFLFLRTLPPSESMQKFKRQVSDYSKSSFNITLDENLVDLAYSMALYDSIMLYAHAATKVLSKGGDLTVGNVVVNAVWSTRIEGVGNREIVLNERGDRIESYEIVNFDWGMKKIPVGKYISTEKEYTAYGPKVVWPGDTTKVPRDFVSGTEI